MKLRHLVRFDNRYPQMHRPAYLRRDVERVKPGRGGSTNADLYKIFMTGVDGTPMPSFAEVIQPNDAWDLVHFLRTLQVNRHGKENDVLKAAGGKIPAYAVKTEAPASQSWGREQEAETKNRWTYISPSHVGGMRDSRICSERKRDQSRQGSGQFG